MSAIGSYLKYNISYYGIILCVGNTTVEQDTYAILVKYLARETAGEKKNTNHLCVLCVVKNCYLLITIFPTANIRRAYAGIGICVDD